MIRKVSIRFAGWGLYNLYDLCDMYDLYDLCDLYDLYDLCDL